MNKILPQHIERKAYVYVRQSSQRQVEEHLESQDLQYQLTHRAQALGWPANQVVVIDDDLGKSAVTATEREGFQILVAAVGLGQVGIILVTDVSRLARNCGDWYQLLDLASVCGTLLSDAGGVYDPHVWMDVSQWRDAVPVIEAALVEHAVDAGCAPEVAARAAEYRALLDDLHAWALAAIASVPAEQRVLVTAHDAFEYFGRAYGIEVEGIQGISTETEAAVADIRRVAELVVVRRVPALFVESTINPRTVNAVLEAVEQRGGRAVIGDELFADALGASGTPEGTYVGMLLHNVSAIVVALGGELPPLPATLAAWETRW